MPPDSGAATDSSAVFKLQCSDGADSPWLSTASGKARARVPPGSALPARRWWSLACATGRGSTLPYTVLSVALVIQVIASLIILALHSWSR